jgi:superfamily II DNA helicase RecQ
MFFFKQVFIFTGIKNGNYSLLYMSPEVMLQFHSWHQIILENSLCQKQLCIIAVDEVHLLETW